MCGILLNISEKKKSPKKSMSDLEKRGPDFSSYHSFNFKNKIITIGHTRLGIIDVNNSNSNQPLVSDNNLLSFNGEIYNYKELAQKYFPLKSFNSDTVLLFEFLKNHPDKTSELRGMFAFCFLDLKTEMCLIMSDPFGKKPIYYSTINNEFTVGSTINAIHYLSPINKSNFSKRALNYYLKYNYTPIDQSIFSDVKKLPGGNKLLLNLNTLDFSFQKYYDVRDINHSSKNSKSNNDIYNKLKVAVERRLLADVNIGIQLSSGVDSSLVAAVASREFNIKPEAFTIVYDNPSHSEESGAVPIANNLGLKHNLVKMTIEDFYDSLNCYYKIYDEPFSDPSAIPTIHLNKSVNKKNIRVLLTGDGGDEFWLGYNRYVTWSTVKQVFKYRRILKPFLYLCQFKLAQKGLLKISFFRKYDLRQFDLRLNQIKKLCCQKNLNSVYESFLAQGDNQKILKPEFFEETNQLSSKKIDIDSMSRNDIINYMQGDILVKNDRASMFYAIETRSPLLDIDFANEALMTDINIRLDKNEGKKTLRLFLNELFPEYSEMFKKGFGFPITEWVTDKEFLNFLKEKINSLKNYSMINEKEIDRRLYQFEIQPEANIFSVWNMFLLVKYLEENKIDEVKLF
jgi:asparagine synthase (glutamine-hydrolysing)